MFALDQPSRLAGWSGARGGLPVLNFPVAVALATASPAVAQADPNVLICPPSAAAVQSGVIQGLPSDFHLDPSGPPITLVKDETPTSAGTRIVLTMVRTGRFTYHVIVQGWAVRGAQQMRMPPETVQQIGQGIVEMFPCPDVGP